MDLYILTQKKKEEGKKMENVDSTVYLRTRLHQSKMMVIKRRRKNRSVFVCAVAQSPGCYMMLSIQPGIVLDCFGIYPYSCMIHITIDVTCYTGSSSQHRKTYQTLSSIQISAPSVKYLQLLAFFSRYGRELSISFLFVFLFLFLY